MKAPTAFLVSFIAFAFSAYSQNKSHEIAHYYDRGEFWCHNHLVLSSDSVFFYAGSCENNIITAKGNWYRRKDQLYLQPWDSVSAFPKVNVIALKESSDTTIYTIKIYDYFGNPYNHVQVNVESSINSFKPTWTDSTGIVNIVRQKGVFYSFFLRFLDLNSDVEKIDSVRYYDFSGGVYGYKIYIDFPASITLDRPVVFAHTQKQRFRIEKDGLYFKKNKAYELKK